MSIGIDFLVTQGVLEHARIFLVDVWASYYILLYVWSLRFYSIDLETELILQGTSKALSGHAIVDDIHDLLSKEWHVTIHCIPRNMNKIADSLVVSMRD
ncbi:hypothetical protein GQ457_09G023520 [Hibiscus cannabinus]